MQVPIPGALEASYQRPATTSRTAVFSTGRHHGPRSNAACPALAAYQAAN